MFEVVYDLLTVVLDAPDVLVFEEVDLASALRWREVAVFVPLGLGWVVLGNVFWELYHSLGEGVVVVWDFISKRLINFWGSW
jgi:hypothetical protein